MLITKNIYALIIVLISCAKMNGMIPSEDSLTIKERFQKLAYGITPSNEVHGWPFYVQEKKEELMWKERLLDAIKDKNFNGVCRALCFVQASSRYDDYKTPLHIAARFGNPAIITLLAHANPPFNNPSNLINKQDAEGNTPLLDAVKESIERNVENIMTLLSLGADHEIMNYKNESPHTITKAIAEKQRINDFIDARDNVGNIIREFGSDCIAYTAPNYDHLEILPIGLNKFSQDLAQKIQSRINAEFPILRCIVSIEDVDLQKLAVKHDA